MHGILQATFQVFTLDGQQVDHGVAMAVAPHAAHEVPVAVGELGVMIAGQEGQADPHHADQEVGPLLAEAARGVEGPAVHDSARSMAVATEWMQTSWFPVLLIMFASLQPQIHFMRTLLHSTSDAHEVHMLTRMMSGHPPQFRALDLHRATAFNTMAEECRQTLHSDWGLPSVDKVRTDWLRFGVRATVVTWQLLYTKWRNFPGRLLSLIDTPTEQNARHLLSFKKCRLDCFSQTILQEYSSVQALLSRELREILCSLATFVIGTTFSTERQHSKNSVRARGRVGVKQAELDFLACQHQCATGSRYLHRPLPASLLQAPRKSARRGRPASSKQAVGTEPEAKRRRQGGGGGQRAYISLNYAGHKLTPDILREASAAYNSWMPEERARYKSIGRQGGSLQKICSDKLSP